MIVFIQIELRYRLTFVLLLSSLITFSQAIKPNLYTDFPLVQNIDSFEQTVRAMKNTSQQYLHGLITIEKNRMDYSAWFGQDLNTIQSLAYQQRSPLAIATYHYLEGIHLQEKSLSEASRNLLESIRYFEVMKDTSGMISCYYAMLVISSNSDIYIINKVQSPQYYYDKIIDLGQKSGHIGDKIIRIRTILTLEKLVKGKQDFNKRIIEVEYALGMSNLAIGTESASLYSAVAGFYLKNNKPHEALKYQLKSYESYKKITSKICLKSYFNLALTYFNLQLYGESEFYVIESINNIEKFKNEEIDVKILLNFYDLLSQIQFNKKDYEASWASQLKVKDLYNQRYRNIKNSLFQELKTQYETNQKEIENASLLKKNELAELMNQKIQQEAELNSLLQRNQLTESQNQKFQKDEENHLLAEKNQAIIAHNKQYKIIISIGSLSFLLVSVMIYFLYRSNNKQKQLILFRDQLFAIIAHDMRTPITAFKGFSDAVAFLLRKGEYQNIHVLSQSIDQLIFNTNLLFDNLLNWYSLQKSNIKATKNSFSIYQLANESKDLYQIIAKNSHSCIEIDIPKSLSIFADRNAMLLILRNLIDNAIKHGKSKTIKIKARREVNIIIIEVINKGTTLSSNKTATLQQQIKQNLIVNKDGRGLGLYLVSYFVQQHNGSLSLESSEQKGTFFKVEIPIKDDNL